jgi:tetratricopeptide (TPR) repeat protein
MGLALRQLARHSAALDAFRRCLELDPALLAAQVAVSQLEEALAQSHCRTVLTQHRVRNGKCIYSY